MDSVRFTPAPPRVLLVDDDRATRRTARRYLEGASYQVLEAYDGAHALAVWERCRGAVDVLVTDVVMPALDGHALAAAFRGRAPRLPIVLISGTHHHVPGQPLAAPLRFVPKPFGRLDLIEAVRDVLSPGDGA